MTYRKNIELKVFGLLQIPETISPLRPHLPESGSAPDLYDSIIKKLFTLPSETKLYPAHDYKCFTSSTIEAEIKNNPRAGGGRTKDQFVEIWIIKI